MRSICRCYCVDSPVPTTSNSSNSWSLSYFQPAFFPYMYTLRNIKRYIYTLFENITLLLLFNTSRVIIVVPSFRCREQVSLLDIPGACFRIKGFMRFMHHRTRMREDVRQQYTRLFDGKTKQHFYVFHRTQEVCRAYMKNSRLCFRNTACRVSRSKCGRWLCFSRFRGEMRAAGQHYSPDYSTGIENTLPCIPLGTGGISSVCTFVF